MCIQPLHTYTHCAHTVTLLPQYCYRYHAKGACRLYHPAERVEGYCEECRRGVLLRWALLTRGREEEREREREREREEGDGGEKVGQSGR